MIYIVHFFCLLSVTYGLIRYYSGVLYAVSYLLCISLLMLIDFVNSGNSVVLAAYSGKS